jgi:hypothetical protein
MNEATAGWQSSPEAQGVILYYCCCCCFFYLVCNFFSSATDILNRKKDTIWNMHWAQQRHKNSTAQTCKFQLYRTHAQDDTYTWWHTMDTAQKEPIRRWQNKKGGQHTLQKADSHTILASSLRHALASICACGLAGHVQHVRWNENGIFQECSVLVPGVWVNLPLFCEEQQLGGRIAQKPRESYYI